MDPRAVPEVAETQSDVFTRAQAHAEGWTPRQVRRRLELGRWRIVAGAALCADDLEIGPWQLAQAALLTWPGSVVSHQVAGQLHGLPVRCNKTGSAIVAPSRKLKAAGLTAHRLHLRDDEIGKVGGMPVTTQRRTAVDLLATISWDDCRSLWSWLATRRLMTLADLDADIAARGGWDGTRQLRELAAASATGSASAGEDRLHLLLRGARIEGWRANVAVHVNGRFVAVVDLLFAQARVVVEFDGYSTHTSREAFQSDRSKQNRLLTAGYIVLRFTWNDVVRRPDYVVKTIRQALAAAR